MRTFTIAAALLVALLAGACASGPAGTTTAGMVTDTTCSVGPVTIALNPNAIWKAAAPTGGIACYFEHVGNPPAEAAVFDWRGNEKVKALLLDSRFYYEIRKKSYSSNPAYAADGIRIVYDHVGQQVSYGSAGGTRYFDRFFGKDGNMTVVYEFIGVGFEGVLIQVIYPIVLAKAGKITPLQQGVAEDFLRLVTVGS
jgi:hypothetical protein